MADRGVLLHRAGALAWIAASLAGWALGFALVFIGGWFIVEAITGDADRILDDGVGFSLSLVIGFSLSAAGWAAGQWLLLRRYGADAVRWVAGAALGFAILAVLNLVLHDRAPILVNELVHNLAAGVAMGLVQRPVLRQLTGRPRPWVTVTVLATLVAATVSATLQLVADVGGDIGGLVGVTAAAAVTGVTIRRWMSHARVAPTVGLLVG